MAAMEQTVAFAAIRVLTWCENCGKMLPETI